MIQLSPKELIQNKFGDKGAALWPKSSDESWKYNKIDAFYSQKFSKLLDQDDPLSESALDELTQLAGSLSATLCSSQNCVHLFLYNGILDEDFNLPALKRLEQLGVVISYVDNKSPIDLTASSTEPRMQFINHLNAKKSLLLTSKNKSSQELIVQFIHASSPSENMAQLVNFDLQVMQGSSLQIVESHLSAGTNSEWRNLDVTVNVEADARLTYVIDQQLNFSSYLFHSLNIVAQDSAKVEVLTSSKGSAMSRFDLKADAHHQSEIKFLGLTSNNKTQKTYHNTNVTHLKELGLSEQLYKSVLDEKSQSVFSGKIRIVKQAQMVSSKQYAKSLLMSEDAESDAKPSLEIFADNVKANHGATVGQLDDAQIFYLQSRGISKDKARQLVAIAFFNEVIDKLKSTDLKEFLKKSYK